VIKLRKYQEDNAKMKIVTDSAADLTAEDLQAHEITVAPLQIQFPDGVINSEDISRDDFYARLKAMWPEIPTTSLPSPGAFADLYRRLAEGGQEILSIHISSGLSGTIESARQGAQMVSDALIQHVDTMTLSGTERFQVLAAAMAAKAGKSKAFILERLDQIRAIGEVVYTLETLTYLAKGGRIGRVQALAGALLNIKPIIHVDKQDGKYSTLGRERTMNKALQFIADHLSGMYQDKALWVSVMHGQATEQAELLAELIRKKLNVERLEILRISPVLGVHTGPGIIGAAVVPMELMQDLE
jgi:DegV family protein with EDD domain